MANYNRVVLAGNLTRDPTLSYLPSQTPACEFGLAVNRKWKSKEGQSQDEVLFIDCRAYGKQAEVLNQYLAKGRSVLIEGRLKLDTWKKDGQRHSVHRVVVENFQFLGDKGESQAAPKAQPEPEPEDAPDGPRIPL